MEEPSLNRNIGVRTSIGKIVFCSMVALVFGLFQPIMLIFQVMMPMPTVIASMIAEVILFVCGGMVPAVVLGISSMVSSLFVFGILTGSILWLSWLIPAGALMMGIRRGEPFFSQISKGIVIAVAAVIFALVGMTVKFGTDMVKLVIDQLRLTFESQQELFWEMLSPMFNGELSQEQFVQVYYDMFNILQLYYENYLLPNLLSGAIIAVLISVLWGNWLKARRGEATNQSYCGMSGWYLSSNTTFGLLLTMGAGFVLSKTSVRGADMAWITVKSLGSLAFTVQCIAAMDRRMKSNGSGYVRRVVILVLLVAFGALCGALGYMAILGCASALFGSKGAAKPLINKFKDDMDGEDR